MEQSFHTLVHYMSCVNGSLFRLIAIAEISGVVALINRTLVQVLSLWDKEANKQAGHLGICSGPRIHGRTSATAHELQINYLKDTCRNLCFITFHCP